LAIEEIPPIFGEIPTFTKTVIIRNCGEFKVTVYFNFKIASTKIKKAKFTIFMFAQFTCFYFNSLEFIKIGKLYVKTGYFKN
jgi:hypothetical protein